ncbi:CHASE2 domain-containing protein [candidate division KSB1 bacterium]
MRSSKHTILFLSVSLGISLAMMLLSFSGIYRMIELKLLDLRFTIRGTIPMDPHIATVDINTASLDDTEGEGRYQDWTRDKYADVVSVLGRYGMRMIGFDIYFPERSAAVLYRGNVPEQESYDYDQLINLFQDYDAKLIDACREAGSVFLGQSFKDNDNQDPEYLKRNTVRTERGQAVIRMLAERGDSWERPDWTELSLDKYTSFEPPIPELAEAVRGVGYAQTVTDIDGMVRKYPLVLIYDGRIYPSLALLMVIDYLEVPRDKVRIVPGEAVYLPLPDEEGKEEVKIPIDDRGMMFVNWAGDWWDPDFHHYPHLLVKRFPEFEADDLAYKGVKGWLSEEPALVEDVNQFVAKLQSEMGSGEIDPQLYFMQYLIITTGLQIEEEMETGVALDTSEWPAERVEFYSQLKETIERNHRIADLLTADGDMTIEAVADGIGVDNVESINREYNLLSGIINSPGHIEVDHPLYFTDLMVAGKPITREDFKDKVLFYGLTATGTHDLNPMPFNPRYPMLGLHANAFNTILTRKFIHRPEEFGNALMMLVIGLMMGFLLPRFRPVVGALFVMLLALVYLMASFFLFKYRGTWIDVTGPVAIITLSYLVITFYNYITEEREKKYIKGAFQHYLSPTVIEQLVDNPDMLSLGGERKVLTAYFSDVAGFSSISEKLEPEELVSLLNEYLTEMCDIILDYEGTVDKFEGDAIIAFFGAPISYDDHAKRACFACLDMQSRLVELRKVWAEQSRPVLNVRMGVNTGAMVVGNMGSKTRMDYTMMGDSVNLAARLEGAGKQYGIYTMISQFTLDVAGEFLEVRELDRIRVMGKEEPVYVYELLSRAGELNSDQKTLVTGYNRGLELYKGAKFKEAGAEFSSLLKDFPDDGPAKTYVARCEEFRAEPPPSEWDGVYVLKSK